MDFGVGYFPTHDGMRPGDIARRVEERGHSALYFAEHTRFEFVDFDRIWSWPKPAQKPWPPIYVGGGGPTVLNRVLAYGDGWSPQWQDSDLFARIEQLRARADRYLPVQALSVPADPKALEQLSDAGVQRVSAWLPSGPWSKVEPALEQWEKATGELVGR